MNIQEELIRSIEYIIEKSIANLKNNDAVGVIKQKKGRKYLVEINGVDYWLKDGVGIQPKVNNTVWIRIPNGNMNNAYISALRS